MNIYKSTNKNNKINNLINLNTILIKIKILITLTINLIKQIFNYFNNNYILICYYIYY